MQKLLSNEQKGQSKLVRTEVKAKKRQRFDDRTKDL
jgi:hypothetical protein